MWHNFDPQQKIVSAPLEMMSIETSHCVYIRFGKTSLTQFCRSSYIGISIRYIKCQLTENFSSFKHGDITKRINLYTSQWLRP